MTDISTVARAQSLLDELAAARADAIRWDFDLPSDEAYQRAESLLRGLCRSSVPTDTIDVSIGENGDIEITAAPGGILATVNVHYLGAVTQMIVQDLKTGTIITPSAILEDSDILKRLERAAGS